MVELSFPVLVQSNVLCAILTTLLLTSFGHWKEPDFLHQNGRSLQQECCTCNSGTSTNNRGRVAIEDFEYTGAFRLKPGDWGGDGSTNLYTANYAVGTLAYNPIRNSIFVAGHAQTTRIAEYPLDGIVPGFDSDINLLPVTDDPYQGFVSPIDSPSINNVQEIDRVTGMMVTDSGSLVMNAERWYDASAQNTDTTLIVQDASDLDGTVNGFYQMTCRAEGAGYVGKIPAEWQGTFGGSTHYTGWSSVHSINSRYSHGPSLFAFSTIDMTNPSIATTPYMNFPFSGGESMWLSPTAADYAAQGTAGPFDPADPVWNAESNGVFGFFVPNSDTFAVIGSSGGITSGIGYKAVQSDGNVCGGPCPYDPNDYYNYYWLFDINDIIASPNVWDPRPYAYGVWDVPYGNSRDRLIIGGTVDEENAILYVAVQNAAQVGLYDRPPLIVTYKL